MDLKLLEGLRKGKNNKEEKSLFRKQYHISDDNIE